MNSDELVLAEIKENSNITEASTSSDIATTQDFVGKFIDEKYNTSLAYQVAEVQPISSSFGSIYASKRNQDTNNFEVVRKDVLTKTFTLKTGYTQEVWQDMQKLFGKRALAQCASILGGISDMDENFSIMNILLNESLTKSEVEVNIEKSGWITSQISKAVADSVIEMNRYGFKTLDSFAIISPKWASAFLGTAGYVKNDADSAGKDSTLFIGRYGRTDFYVNPFRNDRNQYSNDYNNDYANTGTPDNGMDYCFVGLKSKIAGESSLIFAPYQYEANSVVDPDQGETSLFLYNRYGLVTNPLHVALEGKSMLHKFILKETP